MRIPFGNDKQKGRETKGHLKTKGHRLTKGNDKRSGMKTKKLEVQAEWLLAGIQG
jgi:hypothetical protein